MAVYTKNPMKRVLKRMRNAERALRYRRLAAGAETQSCVLFISFGGREYADNPKAVSDRLHEIAPEIRQAWVLDRPEAFVGKLPIWVEPVCSDRESYLPALAKSAVWVSNFELPHYVSKKSDQLYIQTYHGDRAFKTVLYEATPVRDLHLMEEGEGCDYLVTGSHSSEEWMPKAFRTDARLLRAGCPRNDVLFDVDAKRREEILGKLGLDPSICILLYAPTFRDWLDGPQSTYGLNFDTLLDELGKKTGRRWACLVRKHPSSKGIEYDRSNPRIHDVSDYPFSDDLLCVTDFLITDYSSIVNDFILRRRPAVLYAPDLDEYLSERDLLFDIESGPYPCVRDFEGLLGLVASMGDGYGEAEYEKVADWYGIYEDGRASERVAQLIRDYLTTQEPRDAGTFKESYKPDEAPASKNMKGLL